MQIGEWAAAIFCWVLLACILFYKLMKWEGVLGQKGLSAFLKFFGALGAVAGCVILVTITDLRKPEEEPWSNLQKLWKHELPQSYRNAMQTSEFIVNPDEHYDEGAIIAGFPWMQGSVLTRLQLQSAPDLRISNVELRLTFDATFIHGAQVSAVPNVILLPKKHPIGISDAEAGGIDKNGNMIDPHSATPEDLENFKSYPTNEFVFKQPEMFPDLPVMLAFIGRSGYRIGNFTFMGGGPWIPHGLKISGHYDVRYRDKIYTVPVDFVIHPQARGNQAH